MRHPSLLCAASAGGCLLLAGLRYGPAGLHAVAGLAGGMFLGALFVRAITGLRWPGRFVLVPSLGWIPGVVLAWAVEGLTDRWLALLALAAGCLTLEAVVRFHDRS